MKKRILIVSQNFIVGGIETRLQGHCKQFIDSGMDVFLLTGLHYKKKFLPKGLKKIFKLDCFHPFVRGIDLINEINDIASIIREQQIDLVIVHPHLSIPSATLAAKQCGVRCGVVLHGALNLENYYGWTHRLLVQIALNIADFVELVSEEVLELTKPFIYHNRYFIERNKICYSTFAENLPSKDPYSIAIVSRLAIDKYDSITNLLKIMSGSKFRIAIFGEGPSKSQLKKFIRKENIKNVQFKGVSTSISKAVKDYYFIAGVDRVVLEGLSQNKPTILAGYDGVKGIIDTPLFNKAEFSNYGGKGGIDNIEKNKFLQQLESCIKQPELYQLRKELKSKIDLNDNFKSYLDTIFNIKDFTINDNISFVDAIITNISVDNIKTKYSGWVKDDRLLVNISKVFNDPHHQQEKIPQFLASILHNYPIDAAQQNLQHGIQPTNKKCMMDMVLFFSYRFYSKLPVKLQIIARNLLKNKLSATRNAPGNTQ
jgi:glycosyltransferase involved in cell wall biosynthesis